MRRLFLIALLFAFPVALHAATPVKPYHIELEANPAAAFPFLSKFGGVDIHLYPGGVSADSIWLDGFSKSGAKDVTVLNPVGRMYSAIPTAQVAPMLAKLAGNNPEREATAVITSRLEGNVKGIPATRHRIQYGPAAWIDVWTTTALPVNTQFRSLAHEFVRGIAPGTAKLMDQLPGMPIYVELNFRRFKKVAILRLKSVSKTNEGEADALKVGAIYFKAPFVDALWK